MGNPRKLRKKYMTPTHPWQKTRIEEEKRLMRQYGFKNKEELWKLNSKLRRFKSQVKDLIPRDDDEALNQKQELLVKLRGLGLVADDAILEDILAITLEDMCRRRLQSVLVNKNMATTAKQARQFIVHEHITVDSRKITSPSYLVSLSEEAAIHYSGNSPLNSSTHPERQWQQVHEKAPVKSAPPKDDKSAEETLKEDVEKEKKAEKE